MGAQAAIAYFTTPDGDRGFAVRRGRDFWAANRWRGYRLCGIQCKRAGAALVAGNQSIRVKLVEGPAGVAA